MNFKEKVQSMTAKEIIMAMVTALTHPPHIKVDMGTFGESRKEKYGPFNLFKRTRCYGCAATNTICEISGVVFDKTNINHYNSRAKLIEVDSEFLVLFERAIDQLRCGHLYHYNQLAEDAGIAPIKVPEEFNFYLDSDYTNEHLKPFIELAENQS